MKPTFQLRWREASPPEEREEPCTLIPRSWMDERFVLEQLWQDDSGKSEWRAIVVERTAVNTART